MFTLQQIADSISGEVTPSTAQDLVVDSVQSSTEQIHNGALFVAIVGAKLDGHTFIEDAKTGGAVAVVVSDRTRLQGLPGIVVKDTRVALSRLASLFVSDVAQQMTTIGITGTNGKTTTNWLLHNALEKLGRRSIRIGTIGINADGIIDLPGVLTTPDPILLHRTLSQAFHVGISHCVIETSSHALHQSRIDDLAPNIGIFTNLTRDHLDYHQSMESYLEAKLHLFALIARNQKSPNGAVVNIDDQYGKSVFERCIELKLPVLTFGRKLGASIRIGELIKDSSGGSVLDLSIEGKQAQIRTPLIGDHNAQNLSAALGALLLLQVDLVSACNALSGLIAAPGRLEEIAGPGFSVFVDYAHTPDALERVLIALRPSTQGRLFVVFGCGGDRDRGKRPLMGEIAQRLADVVVVTSDNPRTEDPTHIINDILSAPITPTRVEPDRAKAVAWAIADAQSGDIVLIAGKGHEDYQILGTTKHHFSDVEVAKREIGQRSQRAA